MNYTLCRLAHYWRCKMFQGEIGSVEELILLIGSGTMIPIL